MDYIKWLVFEAFGEFEVRTKSGEVLSFESYSELEAEFKNGKIHPLDLKLSLVDYLDKLVAPIRQRFETPEGRAYLSILA
jgi:tyrosyl-tRNA synthetase